MTDATILLVEDEEPIRSMLQEVLKREGYVVLPAVDGREALEIASRHPGPIDMALSDVVMPRMSGVQLAPLLRRRRPGIKLLYMSGYAGESFFSQGLIRPGVPFLQKPFSPAVLSHKIREMLGRSSAA